MKSSLSLGIRDNLSATYNSALSSLPLQMCPVSHSDCEAHHLEAAIHEYYDVAMCDAVQCQGISTITHLIFVFFFGGGIFVYMFKQL